MSDLNCMPKLTMCGKQGYESIFTPPLICLKNLKLHSSWMEGVIFYFFKKYENDMDCLALVLWYIQGSEFKASKVVLWQMECFQLYC